MRQLDRFLAEDARELYWDGLVDSKDAVHVATALQAGVVQLDTFDEGLLRRDGKIGDPPMRIGTPSMPLQTTWLESGQEAEVEQTQAGDAEGQAANEAT